MAIDECDLVVITGPLECEGSHLAVPLEPDEVGRVLQLDVEDDIAFVYGFTTKWAAWIDLSSLTPLEDLK